MLQKWSLFDDMYNLFGLPVHDAPMDVREDEKEFEIEVDLPGVDPANINIGVLGNKLSVKADRKWAKNNGRAAFSRSFAETFILPQTVDIDGISATYGQGVLRVMIPKKDAPAARKVEVKLV
jgi:HSP20 family protein